MCESHDDKGNVVCYRYKAEESPEDLSAVSERHRADRTANRYLERIRYGNHESYFPVLSADAVWPSPAGRDRCRCGQDLVLRTRVRPCRRH